MEQGRGRFAWDQTALIVATIINAIPFRDAPPVDALSFNPYRQDEPPPPIRTITGEELAQMWCGQAAIDYFNELDRIEATNGCQ